MAQEATQPTKETPPVVSNMTEAGFSLNVKLIDPHGSEVMLTFRAPMVQQADRLLTHFNTTMTRLIGVEGWRVAGARPAANGASNAPVENGAPVCRVHNVSMKPSKHGGGHYCPKKDDSGNWCKEKA